MNLECQKNQLVGINSPFAKDQSPIFHGFSLGFSMFFMVFPSVFLWFSRLKVLGVSPLAFLPGWRMPPCQGGGEHHPVPPRRSVGAGPNGINMNQRK